MNVKTVRVVLDDSPQNDISHWSRQGPGTSRNEHGAELEPGEQGLIEALGQQLGFAYIDCTVGMAGCTAVTTKNHDASELDQEPLG